MRPRLSLGAGLLTIAVLGVCGVAQAQTFTVTNTSDSGAPGDGSLRGEVASANASSGADAIAFASGLSGTITLSGDGLQIHEALDIEGPGPAQLTVAQSSPKRVVHIEMTGPVGPVTIAGLHLANGTSTSEGGGDIYNDDAKPASSLTVINSAITGGTAGEYGGGIDAFNTQLTVRTTTFENNHANAAGALWTGDDGGVAVTIESSTFTGNSASEFGGALFIEVQEGGNVLLSDSTFSGNNSGEEGGAIAISANETNVNVANITVTGNTSASDGGGGLDVETTEEAVTIADSTIAGNHADGSGGSGGGIHSSSTHPVKLEDTIVAGNLAAVESPDLRGLFKSAFDLIGDPTGATLTDTSPGSTILRVDPQLGPLQSNGGPTQTMALPPSSPAVNKGSGALTTDQRGLPRPVAYPGAANSTASGANGADIGAFELQAPPPPSNRFGFGKVKLNRRKGTATVSVKLPGPGSLVMAGKKVKKVTKIAKSAGTVKVLVKATGRARRSLARNGKLKVKAKFTFTPNGGSPASRLKKLKLVKTAKR